MEGVRHYFEFMFLSIWLWFYHNLEYTLSIPVSIFVFKSTSRIGYQLAELAGRMTFGVGVGLLTAFVVTVYKVKWEKKVIKWLEEKKDKKEKSEAQD
jgi:hypothetical protein